MAVGWDLQGLVLAMGRCEETACQWNARVLFHPAHPCLHDLVLAGPARIVCRVDGTKLAAVYKHLLRDQRASLRPDNVSHFHSLRTFHRRAIVLVRYHYFLVANVHGALHHPLRAGRVGVLTIVVVSREV